MALVSYYSESESESEAPPPPPPPPPKPPSKKPFQKVVDRSNGKIIVNLNQPSATASSSINTNDQEPPSKRARTSDSRGGAGLFKGFNSFLPPPKNVRSAPIKPSSASQTPRPGIHLKTSAEVGFSRDEALGAGMGSGFSAGSGGDEDAAGGGAGGGQRAQPSVSEDLKPANEVKLVGKPLMFKPLSVARNTKKRPKSTPPPPPPRPAAAAAATTSTPPPSSSTPPASKSNPQPTPAQHDAQAAPIRTSLFSLHVEEPPAAPVPPSSSFPTSTYEPLFSHHHPDPPQPISSSLHPDTTTSYDPAPTRQADPNSLHSVADDLNLSAAARRELFGRAGTPSGPAASTGSNVITLNMDQEYRQNEALRAAGEQQLHNPVRAIQGGGKHSLRQLVHNVVNQREALEDSFAKGKSNRKETSSKYGW